MRKPTATAHLVSKPNLRVGTFYTKFTLKIEICAQHRAIWRYSAISASRPRRIDAEGVSESFTLPLTVLPPLPFAHEDSSIRQRLSDPIRIWHVICASSLCDLCEHCGHPMGCEKWK